MRGSGLNRASGAVLELQVKAAARQPAHQRVAAVLLPRVPRIVRVARVRHAGARCNVVGVNAARGIRVVPQAHARVLPRLFVCLVSPPLPLCHTPHSCWPAAVRPTMEIHLRLLCETLPEHLRCASREVVHRAACSARQSRQDNCEGRRGRSAGRPNQEGAADAQELRSAFCPAKTEGWIARGQWVWAWVLTQAGGGIAHSPRQHLPPRLFKHLSSLRSISCLFQCADRSPFHNTQFKRRYPAARRCGGDGIQPLSHFRRKVVVSDSDKLTCWVGVNLAHRFFVLK